MNSDVKRLNLKAEGIKAKGSKAHCSGECRSYMPGNFRDEGRKRDGSKVDHEG